MNPKTNLSDLKYLTMMDDLNKLQNTMDRLTAENNDLKDRIRNLGVDYDYAKNAASKSNDEARSAKTQLETQTSALRSTISKLDAANVTISKLDAVIRNEEWKQSRTLKTSEDESKRLENNYEHAKNAIDQLTKTLAFANKKIEELKNSENHLAQKTISLYNTNQTLNAQIVDLTNQIEEFKKPIEKSTEPESDIPLTPEGNIDVEKLRPGAALTIVNMLKKDLSQFNEKPFYIRLIKAPKLLDAIFYFVNSIGKNNTNAAPRLTPNTSLYNALMGAKKWLMRLHERKNELPPSFFDGSDPKPLADEIGRILSQNTTSSK